MCIYGKHFPEPTVYDYVVHAELLKVKLLHTSDANNMTYGSYTWGINLTYSLNTSFL